MGSPRPPRRLISNQKGDRLTSFYTGISNNGKPPNAAAMEEITQHVRQTFWITPEPRWGWSLGSCDMPLYEPLCDRVEVVRTVGQLAGVAEELVKTRA